ncbi:sel1 repeat family protein [Aliiglaciecola sp.]|nr:sel1 repeat family protein [Aliiglaciecola sp.]
MILSRLTTIFLLLFLGYFAFFTKHAQADFFELSSPNQELTTQQLVTLGLRHENGEGVEQSYQIARQYYQLAIQAGSDQAMHNLGVLYSQGLGVPKNRPKALDMWEQASQQGNMYSSYNMGNAFQLGRGRPKDLQQALTYFMLSFEQGYSDGVCQFATVLIDVDPTNSESTREMLEPIAMQGNNKCLHNLIGLLYEDFEQHQNSQSLLHWSELGASRGLVNSIFTLALIYDFGEKGTPTDPQKAKSYYLKAAELLHVSAYSNLGFMYESGKFGNPDFVLAKKYYEKGVAMDSEWALNNLATFYREGIGKIVDFEKSLQLYRRSAAMNNAYAYRNLGNMYRHGEGVKPDAFVAQNHLLKSIELGYLQSLLDLGLLYLDESLPLYNKATALSYFYQAVEKQIPDAIETLAEQFSDEEREWFVLSQVSGQVAYDIAAYYQEVKDNPLQACKWYLVAFERRQDDAYLEVMPCVRDGFYVDTPYMDQLDVAREWAAYQDWDPDSLVGELLYYGIGVSENKVKAAKYFLKSHEITGDEIARYKLGLMYLAGDGVVKDDAMAIYFFELAAKQDVSVAALELGKIYRDGIGVTVNEERALNYMQQAAEYIDSPESAFIYAGMLYQGYAKPQNIRLAIDWYDRAIQLGHEDASCQLGQVLTSHFANPEEQARAVQLREKCD